MSSGKLETAPPGRGASPRGAPAARENLLPLPGHTLGTPAPESARRRRRRRLHRPPSSVQSRSQSVRLTYTREQAQASLSAPALGHRAQRGRVRCRGSRDWTLRSFGALGRGAVLSRAGLGAPRPVSWGGLEPTELPRPGRPSRSHVHRALAPPFLPASLPCRARRFRPPPKPEAPPSL